MNGPSALIAVKDRAVRGALEHLEVRDDDPERRFYVRDLGLHLDALMAAMSSGGAEQFAEYCGWCAVLLDALQGTRPSRPGAGLAAALEALDAALATALEDPSSAHRLIAAGRARIARRPRVAPAALDPIPLLNRIALRTLAPIPALEAGREAIAALAVVLHYARRPALAIAHRGQRQRFVDRTAGLMASLVEAIRLESLELFADRARWTLGTSGLERAALAAELESLSSALTVALSPGAGAAARTCVQAGIEAIYVSRPLPPTLRPEDPHHALAQRYLAALLVGDRRAACHLVLQATKDGAPIDEIYLHVFQACQYEIGRRWEMGELSVAQEHLATAITQLAMSQLYPLLFTGEPGDRSVVASSVGEDLHELGVRFVADFFEMSGWQTLYLGANTPTAHLVGEIARRRPDLIALGATLVEQLPSLRAAIAALRAHPACQEIPILVGGQPFNRLPDLWRQVGADGWASDAREAIAAAERLVGEEPI